MWYNNSIKQISRFCLQKAAYLFDGQTIMSMKGDSLKYEWLWAFFWSSKNGKNAVIIVEEVIDTLACKQWKMSVKLCECNEHREASGFEVSVHVAEISWVWKARAWNTNDCERFFGVRRTKKTRLLYHCAITTNNHKYGKEGSKWNFWNTCWNMASPSSM